MMCNTHLTAVPPSTRGEYWARSGVTCLCGNPFSLWEVSDLVASLEAERTGVRKSGVAKKVGFEETIYDIRYITFLGAFCDSQRTP